MTVIPRKCSESCFQYDPERKGCSYNEMDFTGTEPIRPGQRCLHPEFDESKLITVGIMDICNALASNSREPPENP